MHRMINMKETLMSCIENQLTHLDTVDTKELGEAIDMVKDLSEAIYYCTITKAMLEREEEQQGKEYHYYTEKNCEHYKEEDDWGKMYYSLDLLMEEEVIPPGAMKAGRRRKRLY